MKAFLKNHNTLVSILTNPGLALIVANGIQSSVTGPAALLVSAIALILALILKLGASVRARLGASMKAHAPMYIAGTANIVLGCLSLADGRFILAAAMVLFGLGNYFYTLALVRRFPVDNLCFTFGTAITAYIGGASLVPSAIILAAGALACSNVLKRSGDRNYGRPKLWLALAQAIAVTLGFSSGDPSRIVPCIALVFVIYSYICMEAQRDGLPRFSLRTK
jgi:hypothetical protein